MHEPGLQGKSHDIPKRLVWDAWLRVEENGGAAGPDGVTIEQFQVKVAIQPGWLGVRELGSGAGGGRGEGLVPDLL